MSFFLQTGRVEMPEWEVNEKMLIHYNMIMKYAFAHIFIFIYYYFYYFS